MSRHKWKNMIMFIAGVVLVAIIAWQLSKSITFAEPLTKDEARTKVQNLYQGEIVKIQEQQAIYVVVINLESGTYEVEIDRATGEIGTLSRIITDKGNTQAGGNQQESPAAPKPENTTDPTIEPTQHITEEEAIAIALQSISGKVDEVKTEQVGGVLYYLIEIEREDGQEGIVEIHGITGEVISITWDD